MCLAPMLFLVGQREIDLSLKSVNARDIDTQFVTHRESASRLAADKSPLYLMEDIENVLQRRNMHHTAYDCGRQFNHESIIAHIDDCGLEHLGITRVHLTLKKFHLFEVHRFNFCVG